MLVLKSLIKIFFEFAKVANRSSSNFAERDSKLSAIDSDNVLKQKNKNAKKQSVNKISSLKTIISKKENKQKKNILKITLISTIKVAFVINQQKNCKYVLPNQI